MEVEDHRQVIDVDMEEVVGLGLVGAVLASHAILNFEVCPLCFWHNLGFMVKYREQCYFSSDCTWHLAILCLFVYLFFLIYINFLAFMLRMLMLRFMDFSF